MVVKKIILTVSFISIMLFSCSKKIVQIDINSEMYPNEQEAVKKTLIHIFDLGKAKQLDSIEDYHLYGPKFTKFNDGGIQKRIDAELAKKGERDLFNALKEFDYSFEDLKIDVFDKISIATFLIDVKYKVGEVSGTAKSRGTVIFVKVGKKWKITHEHFSTYIEKKSS